MIESMQERNFNKPLYPPNVHIYNKWPMFREMSLIAYPGRYSSDRVENFTKLSKR